MNVYDVITDLMVKALESGSAPWRKPWNASAGGGPRNIEGRPYRGMNVFLLLATGHASPYWLTLRQIKERGGQITKGEHYTPVIFWTLLKRKNAVTGDPETIPMLKYYKVWNLEQTTGINPPKGAETATKEFDPIEAAEKVMANYPDAPLIQCTGNAAFYRPGTDEITLPPRESFNSADEFYSTAFHEMTHSTGHSKRLNRKNWASSPFGSHDYGREELVAEMGAAFLCGETGILPATMDNSAAYLRSWIKTIKADPRAVVVAAGAAQRAADHILNRHPEDGHEKEDTSE